MKAVIPAAGLGTRFLPATKSMPKEMLPLVDRPSIQYVVEEAVASGCEDLLLITGRGKRAVEDHFDKAYELEDHLVRRDKKRLLQEVRTLPSGAVLHYVRQREPNGLGDAVLTAARHVGREPFAVLLGDDVLVDGPTPVTRQLVDAHRETGCAVIAVQEVPEAEVHKYGVISFEDGPGGTLQVTDIVEKPPAEEAPSRYASVGRYVLLPEVFDHLRETPLGRGGELQLTDALKPLAREGKLLALPFHGERFDVGSKAGWLRANVLLALQRPEFRDAVAALVEEARERLDG